MTRSQTHHDKRLIDGSDPDDWGQRTCPDCEGLGKVQSLFASLAVLRNGAGICPTCDGTGYIEDDGSDDGDRAYDEWVDRQEERR